MTDLDLTRYGEDYARAYQDELDSCELALDRVHPGWRQRKPFNELPVQQLAMAKRCLVRQRQIAEGFGGHRGTLLVWRRASKGPGRPYVAAIPVDYDALGHPIWTEAHRQLINPALLATRMGLPFELVEQALKERPPGDRDARAFVAAFVAERRSTAH